MQFEQTEPTQHGRCRSMRMAHSSRATVHSGASRQSLRENVPRQNAGIRYPKDATSQPDGKSTPMVQISNTAVSAAVTRRAIQENDVESLNASIRCPQGATTQHQWRSLDTAQPTHATVSSSGSRQTLRVNGAGSQSVDIPCPHRATTEHDRRSLKTDQSPELLVDYGASKPFVPGHRYGEERANMQETTDKVQKHKGRNEKKGHGQKRKKHKRSKQERKEKKKHKHRDHSKGRGRHNRHSNKWKQIVDRRVLIPLYWQRMTIDSIANGGRKAGRRNVSTGRKAGKRNVTAGRKAGRRNVTDDRMADRHNFTDGRFGHVTEEPTQHFTFAPALQMECICPDYPHRQCLDTCVCGDMSFHIPTIHAVDLPPSRIDTHDDTSNCTDPTTKDVAYLSNKWVAKANENNFGGNFHNGAQIYNGHKSFCVDTPRSRNDIPSFDQYRFPTTQDECEAADPNGWGYQKRSRSRRRNGTRVGRPVDWREINYW